MAILYGLPQNLAHTDDPYQSLLTEIAKRNAIAQYQSLVDASLVGTIAVTGGHDHTETANTVLDWMQLGTWPTVEGVDTTDQSTRGAVRVDTHIARQLGFLPVIVPQGKTTIIPRARMTTTGGKTMTVTIDYMAPSNLNTVAVAGGTITNGGVNTTNGWIVGSSADVSGIALTNGLRLVYVSVQTAYSFGSHGHLFEIQVTYV
jgi:hypothetical protein